jgi:ornithine decarboxylase
VLSNKFGANEPDWRRMLVHMKERGLHCAGVSFHVGSGACTPSAFSSAIASAAAAFELARETGHSPNILDIGGGFSLSTMDDLAPVVNEAIETHFGDQPDIQIIAEPGRLFAEHSAAFAVQIIGMRESVTTEKRQYWITDGLYGSFNCVLFDHAVIQSPIVLKKDGSLADDSGGALETADVFGATCDGLDTVSRDIKIPRAEVGDWLLFPDMGAYTIAGATTFNGILFNQVRTFDA